MWGLIALGAIGVIVLANALRARRTGSLTCLGHFFVTAQELTPVERVLNRGGIALFVGSVLASFIL